MNLSHIKGLHRARILRNHPELRLNLACGRNTKLGWMNIDFTPEADFALDLRKPLPFQDNSCSMVYSEHFLEHVEYPHEAEAFLREVFRVLKGGGVFRVGVPDTETAIAAYMEGEKSAYYSMIRERQLCPDWCKTPMEHLNVHFRHWDHCFAYDFETLESVLKRCGFVEIARRPFDPELDSALREGVTMYVDASKPQDRPDPTTRDSKWTAV